MARKRSTAFNPTAFLTKVGSGKAFLYSKKNDVLFLQGDDADAVFYIQEGRVKLTVVSAKGKEAVVAILERTDFFGESCLAGQPLRMASARALDAPSRLKRMGASRLLVAAYSSTSRSMLGIPHRVSRGAHGLTNAPAERLRIRV